MPAAAIGMWGVLQVWDNPRRRSASCFSSLKQAARPYERQRFVAPRPPARGAFFVPPAGC